MNFGHVMENEFLARKYGITRKSDNFFKKETIAVFYELLAFEKMVEILREEKKTKELKQHIQDMKMKIYWQLFDFPSIIMFQTKYIKILEKIGKKKKKITNNQIMLMTEEITKEYEKMLKQNYGKEKVTNTEKIKYILDTKNYISRGYPYTYTVAVCRAIGLLNEFRNKKNCSFKDIYFMHDKLNNQVITKEEFDEALEYVEKLEKIQKILGKEKRKQGYESSSISSIINI